MLISVVPFIDFVDLALCMSWYVGSLPLCIWFAWKMWVCVMISVWLAGQVSAYIIGKNFNIMIFSDTINIINHKCLTWHGGSTHWALPIHTTISDLDYIKYISRPQQCQSFNWKFYVLIRLSWHFVWLLIMSSRSWIYHFFFFGCFFAHAKSKRRLENFLAWK